MPTPKKTALARGLDRALTEYFRERGARLALERDVKEYKRREASMLDAITELMPKGIDKVSGSAGSISTKIVTVGKVHSWPDYYKWIRRGSHFECLEKRVHQGNLAEVLEHSPRSKPGGIVFEQIVKVTATASRK